MRLHAFVTVSLLGLLACATESVGVDGPAGEDGGDGTRDAAATDGAAAAEDARSPEDASPSTDGAVTDDAALGVDAGSDAGMAAAVDAALDSAVDGPHDAGIDAPKDAAQGGDGGVDGGGADASDASACYPHALAGFSPTWHPPPALGACTMVQLQTFAHCMFDSTPDASCPAFFASAANAGCNSCMNTPSTASHWGTFVSSHGFLDLNVAGCIARLSGDVSSAGCGAKYGALMECREAMCDPYCSAPSDRYECLSNASACTTVVDLGSCSTLPQAAEPCDPAGLDAVGATIRYGNIFCRNGSPDAGI